MPHDMPHDMTHHMSSPATQATRHTYSLCVQRGGSKGAKTCGRAGGASGVLVCVLVWWLAAPVLDDFKDREHGDRVGQDEGYA